MDLLDLLEATDPESDNAYRDATTGEPVSRNHRCEGCGQTAYGPCYAVEGQRGLYRTVEGWLTLSRCRCGRLRYKRLERREPSAFWLREAPSQWGPIVPMPDVSAWLAGGELP